MRRQGLRLLKHCVLFGLLLAMPWWAHAQARLVIGGSGGALAGLQALGQAFSTANPENTVVVLPSLGSPGAIKALTDGGIDIGVIARPLSEVERSKGMIQTDFATTPFVIATGMGTKADRVTLRQLADIYSFKTVAWPDGSRIRLVMRLPREINTEALKALSPEMNRAVSSAEKRPGLLIAMNDQDCAEALERTIGALGPSTLGQIISEKRQLKVLALDGVVPTLQALRNGTYPHVRRLFLVTGPKSNPAAGRFVVFAHSTEGRRILGSMGFLVR